MASRDSNFHLFAQTLFLNRLERLPPFALMDLAGEKALSVTLAARRTLAQYYVDGDRGRGGSGSKSDARDTDSDYGFVDEAMLNWLLYGPLGEVHADEAELTRIALEKSRQEYARAFSREGLRCLNVMSAKEATEFGLT